VLTQRGLGQKTHLAVVQVGGETLLLGVTPHQISTLSKLAPAPAAIAGDSFRGGEKQIPLDESMPNPPLERDELYLKADQEQGFERTLAKEVKRVRNSLWTSLKRLET